MSYQVTILPKKLCREAELGTNLLAFLRECGAAPESPCGGHGSCGKCRVTVNGKEALACQTEIDGDMTVVIPETSKTAVLETGIEAAVAVDPVQAGYLLAFDIGTTTVVGYLLHGKDGHELAHASMLNPQSPHGADVISRIQAAMDGELATERDEIQAGLAGLTEQCCAQAGISAAEIGTVCVVGNPAMQQLFMGIDPHNLAAVPFAPVLTELKYVPAAEYISCCTSAKLIVVPDISGYVGADTMGCVLSTKMYEQDPVTLMVDIGTNGEMVLGNKKRMIACSTAAGPALEGAKIRFGMRGAPGAIDHVKLADGKLVCSVIGGGEAAGICGSGLIDAIAALLNAGLVNARGRIQTTDEVDGQRVVYLTNKIYLTQDDIRAVQLAKGAIAAGIELMAKQLGIGTDGIERVLLAGAFGSFMDPESACRISLLPPVLRGKITAVGNAAGSGSRMMACSREQAELAQRLVEKIEFLELASLPEFQHCFGMNTRF